jgi:hypothetical protein
VEAIKSIGGDATAVWVGNSPLIAACAGRTGLPTLNIQRELAPGLFELNRLGAWNGHIPVTAVNSAILAVAAILYGYDSIAFANERSASAATLEYEGQQVNHQWSKGYAFEQLLGDWLHTHVAAISITARCCGRIRSWPSPRFRETHAVLRRVLQLQPQLQACLARSRPIAGAGSVRNAISCFSRWRRSAQAALLAIFGRNLLDDETQAAGFDALLEYQDHKPFECVGEGAEARAAMYALSQRRSGRKMRWSRVSAARSCRSSMLRKLALEPWLVPSGEHRVPRDCSPRWRRSADARRPISPPIAALANQRVAIWGFGREGRAAITALRSDCHGNR